MGLYTVPEYFLYIYHKTQQLMSNINLRKNRLKQGILKPKNLNE